MKVFLNLSILFLIFQTTYAQNSDIFYKLKINYSNGEDLIELANNGVCIDHGFNKKNHFFKPIELTLQQKSKKESFF